MTEDNVASRLFASVSGPRDSRPGEETLRPPEATSTVPGSALVASQLPLTLFLGRRERDTAHVAAPPRRRCPAMPFLFLCGHDCQSQ